MKSDQLEKTEPATAKRVAEARKEGIIPRSRELATTLFLLGAMAVLYTYSAPFLQRWQQLLTSLFGHLDMPIDSLERVTRASQVGIFLFLKLLVPLFLAFTCIALISYLFQTSFTITWNQITPQWHRINPFNINHLKNRFDLYALYRFFWGYLRIGIVLFVCWTVGIQALKEIIGLPRMETIDLLLFIIRKGGAIAFWSALLLCGFGVLDWGIQKFRIMQRLNMSKREVKEEQRMTDGNPAIKNHRKTLMRNLFVAGRLSDLSRASLLIVGLDIAVAVRYDASVMDVPICLKKGLRRNSQKMVEEANRLGVKVIYDATIASSIWENVEIGQCVHPEHYQIIAEALSHEFK